MSSPEVFSDRYELVRHIARGGMAQVYLAQDLLLDRPVAIKVLFPELSSDPSFVERFRREAQAAANLSHANIVSIYDWGQGEHTYFIVMEYIDGQTLSSLIRQGPLTPLRAAAIGADIASGLDFAHRRGVIHRDVKPGNVLIDRTGQVKVADFGIARAVSHASEGLTQTGAVMGTATYFSPEQAQGLPVDSRSDVYSLGVVLYEMVTGKPPFSGDSPVAIAYKHVREYPSLPSSINASVPADFDAIVMAAMAKDPEDRYQSASDLRDDLIRFQRGQGILAPHPAGGQPTRAIGGPPPYYPYEETHGQHGTSVLDQMETAYAGDYAADQGRPRSRAVWWASLFIVLVAVLGVLVFFIGRNDGWWGAPGDLNVPSLKGSSVSVAEAKLSAEGFPKPSLHYQHSSLVQNGLVISSSPAAGARVPPNTPITLDVSSGAPMVSVPPLAGYSCGAADTALHAKDLVYRNVPHNSSTVASGKVISTDPAAGQDAQQGGTVTVYCSAGEATTVVPDLQGLTADQAGFKLGTDHLKPGPIVSVASATIKAGLVAYTSPSQGNLEPWGTAVTLYVSGGQATTIVPPDLVGKNEAQAQKELAAAQLGFDVETEPVTNPAQNGYVIATHPTPGSSIRQGSLVTLYVGVYTGPPPTKPTTTTTTTTTTPPATTTTTTPPATTTTAAATTTTSPPATTTTSPPATTTTPPAATTTSPAATTTTSPAATTTTSGAASTTTLGGGPPATTPAQADGDLFGRHRFHQGQGPAR
jgi:eukaryotic-like serine/threonine-protein kinase